MKEPIDPLAAASHILQALSGGILLTTRREERINTMTIAWACSASTGACPCS